MHIHIMSVRFFYVAELFFSFSAYICQHLRVWVDTIGWNHSWRWILIYIYKLWQYQLCSFNPGDTELDRLFQKSELIQRIFSYFNCTELARTWFTLEVNVAYYNQLTIKSKKVAKFDKIFHLNLTNSEDIFWKTSSMNQNTSFKKIFHN